MKGFGKALLFIAIAIPAGVLIGLTATRSAVDFSRLLIQLGSALLLAGIGLFLLLAGKERERKKEAQVRALEETRRREIRQRQEQQPKR